MTIVFVEILHIMLLQKKRRMRGLSLIFLTNDIMPHIATNDLYKKLYIVGINDFLCYGSKIKRDVVLQQIKYANNEFDSSFDSATKRELNKIAIELLEYNHYNYKK